MPRQIPGSAVQQFTMVQPQPAKSAQGSALRYVDEFKMPKPTAGREWQPDAYYYTDEVGEVGYVHNLAANTFAACNLRLKQRNRQTDELEDCEDPRALRVDKAFVGPRGGRTELMRRAALNKRIAGEVYLLGTPEDHEDGSTKAGNQGTGLLWEFVSCRELVTDVQGQTWRNVDGTFSGRQLVDRKTTFIARWWTSSPEFSALPDTAMKRAIPACRKMVMLNGVIEAAIKSRLSADIMAVPDGMTFAGQSEDPNADADPDGDIDPFVETLFEHLTAPVEDRASAASLVPLVVRGTPADIEALKMMGIGHDLVAWAMPLYEKVLESIGHTLDIPPEMLKGKGELNHWTGYSVDDQFVSKHVIPEGEDFAEWATTSYLRPMLVAFEGLTEEEAEDFVWEFDPSDIQTNADAGTTAITLHREGLLGGVATVTANGFTEADMPTPEEQAIRLLRDLIMQDPTLIEVFAKFIPGLDKLKIDMPVEPAKPEPPRAIDPGRPGPRAIEPRDPQSGGGEPTPPSQKIAARQIATVASRELLPAIQYMGAQRFPRSNGAAAVEARWDDMWTPVIDEARQITYDFIVGEIGVAPNPARIELAMAMLRKGLTLHAQVTRGAEVDPATGLRVPTDLVNHCLEVALGRG